VGIEAIDLLVGGEAHRNRLVQLEPPHPFRGLLDEGSVSLLTGAERGLDLQLLPQGLLCFEGGCLGQVLSLKPRLPQQAGGHSSQQKQQHPQGSHDAGQMQRVERRNEQEQGHDGAEHGREERRPESTEPRREQHRDDDGDEGQGLAQQGSERPADASHHEDGGSGQEVRSDSLPQPEVQHF